MESYNLTSLKPGEKLLVKTESGSTYHLEAETVPEPISASGIAYRGLRATRESDHEIAGRPESIEDEPSILITHSATEREMLQTGDWMEIAWDRNHPESKEDWDIQFGPKFHTVSTTRIVDIELVPHQALEASSN